MFEDNQNWVSFWDTICDCGTVRVVSQNRLLKDDGLKSCIKCMSIIKYGNLVGLTYGDLMVVERHRNEPDGELTSKWNTLCKCGNYRVVKPKDLASGKVVSCLYCTKMQGAKKNVEARKDSREKRRREKTKLILGQMFGELSPIKEILDPKERGYNKKYRMWECLCSCGNTVYIRESNLLYRNTTRCNNCADTVRAESKMKDLSGRRFGKLTAISGGRICPDDDSGRYGWECICDCGRSAYPRIGSLIAGAANSCGCIRSVAEMGVQDYLTANKISFVREKTFVGCEYKYLLRFDFYLPHFNLCIECDGQHHYDVEHVRGGQNELQEIQRRDAIKTKFCKNNGIRLLRIPYFRFSNIEEILGEQVSMLCGVKQFAG